jgi:hypothetical protein
MPATHQGSFRREGGKPLTQSPSQLQEGSFAASALLWLLPHRQGSDRSRCTYPLATCAVAILIAFVNIDSAMASQSMFVFVQQADSPGNDYSRIDHSSFEKCELSCERDMACNAFTYNQIKGECFLKKAPAQWTTIRLGAITGIKLSPLQLPPEGE